MIVKLNKSRKYITIKHYVTFNSCIASNEQVEEGVIGLKDSNVLILDVWVPYELRVLSELGVTSKDGGWVGTMADGVGGTVSTVVSKLRAVVSLITYCFNLVISANHF